MNNPFSITYIYPLAIHFYEIWWPHIIWGSFALLKKPSSKQFDVDCLEKPWKSHHLQMTLPGKP